MRAFAIASLIVFSSLAFADSPAPWAVCEGKKAGDSCNNSYYPGGHCTAVDGGNGCTPDAGTCLWCTGASGGGGGGGGGCDIGAEGAATGAAFLGALGLALLMRRRRA
jgi:hypothetical protein